MIGGMHKINENGGEQIEIPGFQPAKTYEVSVRSRRNGSDAVRQSSPYVFECYTDPRGKLKLTYHSIGIGNLTCLIIIKIIIGL